MTQKSLPADIWQVEYKLYIKFACGYLQEYNAIPDTTQHGFMTTIYGGDLKKWSLEHMRELTTKASKLRAKRTLDDSVLAEIKALEGYKQLVKLMKGYKNEQEKSNQRHTKPQRY